jgi:two-component system, chemotaxis family, protein-glutamate methylesterase/glutaminase
MIRVLVVEDSLTMRKMIVDILNENTAIEVVGEAVNGRQAVQMAAHLNPDLITMDVFMPDLDGIEATRQIMAQSYIPILIVTGQVDTQEMNVVFEAMKAGALDVIAKPVSRQDARYQAWVSEFIEKVQLLSQVDSIDIWNINDEDGKNHE